MPARAGVFAAAFIVMAVFSAEARAQGNAQAWKWCVNEAKESPDLQISGCTTIIRSGRESNKNLAIAFNNRGNAYYDKKEHDRAIADYDQAIKLDPNYARAFYNRGISYDDKGLHDRAIEDYTHAIRLS